MPSFTGINHEICEIAWLMTLPMVTYLAQTGVTTREDGCIVVANPHERQFEILFSVTVQPVSADNLKYYDIATAKAQQSHRTGMSSSMMQTQYPHLYLSGDTKWGGSTVAPGGLVVAFSGVQAVFDELIAEVMASCIRALCRYEMTRQGGVMDSDSAWLE